MLKPEIAKILDQHRSSELEERRAKKRKAAEEDTSKKQQNGQVEARPVEQDASRRTAELDRTVEWGGGQTDRMPTAAVAPPGMQVSMDH